MCVASARESHCRHTSINTCLFGACNPAMRRRLSTAYTNMRSFTPDSYYSLMDWLPAVTSRAFTAKFATSTTSVLIPCSDEGLCGGAGYLHYPDHPPRQRTTGGRCRYAEPPKGIIAVAPSQVPTGGVPPLPTRNNSCYACCHFILFTVVVAMMVTCLL